MFERFGHDARRAVVEAQEAARELEHDYVGTEHLLLGILQVKDGVGERALRTMGISFQRVRHHVVRFVGTGDAGPAGPIPFTSRARRALERAGEAADARGSSAVGTGHLLLGLIDDAESIGARILVDLDATDDAIRVAVDMHPAGPRSSPPDSGVPIELPRPDVPASPFQGPVDFGWRGRPIVLAALGAGALSRVAFHPSRTGGISAVEMQILASLALKAGEGEPDEGGVSLEWLDVAVAREPGELDYALGSLTRQGLVVDDPFPGDPEDAGIALTQDGVAAVQAWLARLAPLFGGWPTSFEGVDDAIG